MGYGHFDKILQFGIGFYDKRIFQTVWRNVQML